MDRVFIGVDPHKKSVTLEARDSREILRATGSFPTDAAGYRLLVEYARQWSDRVWAVEGANGIGRPLAQRLLAAGERVLDVPAKLAARARVFDTGQGRKTDATDAHAIVMVALRDRGLREVSNDPELTMLRLLCDRRDELSRARAQALNRMHRLFLELVPGGAPVKKSASQYKTLLASVRPSDPAGKMRRRMAAEELADIERLDAKLKAMKAELKTAVLATGSHLMDIHGIGPAGAARILADVGDVTRFPNRSHFASWTGTAPIDASSGQHIRHRLSRAGNRRINHVLYMAGIVQLRNDTIGRRYYRRRRADGKTSMEAMRCLRRRLSDAVYRQLAADTMTPRQAGPGGHSGATLSSSAADHSPVIGSSDKPLPGPALPTLLPPTAATKPADPGTGATPRRRAGGVNVQRPAGRTTLTPTSAVASSEASRIHAP
ncbi:MAG TPA: IS110 family transposase [Streptosporangiaceae bacterium]|nr:IS110 family transposase [Streptosporangiaceae bacterium]